jgi:hypothetical protein
MPASASGLLLSAFFVALNFFFGCVFAAGVAFGVLLPDAAPAFPDARFGN